MEKPKIQRVVFVQGTTVTLPQPVGSRSSLDCKMHGVEIDYHPIGIKVTKAGMDKSIVVPYAQVNVVEEDLEEQTVEVKRGPGRPKAVDTSAH